MEPPQRLQAQYEFWLLTNNLLKSQERLKSGAGFLLYQLGLDMNFQKTRMIISTAV